MRSYSQIAQDFQRVGINFLMTELDIARSLIDLAKSTPSPDRRERLIWGAERALNEAETVRSRFHLNDLQRLRIERSIFHSRRSLARLKAQFGVPPEVRKAA